MARKIVVNLIAALTGAMALGAAATSSEPPHNDPLYMRLIATPRPGEAAVLDGGGRKYSAFEVHLTNFGQTSIRLTQVEVTATNGAQRLFTEVGTGRRLNATYAAVASDYTKPQEPVLKPGQAGILFLFPDFAPERGIPDTFATAISVKGEGLRGSSGTIEVAPIPVSNGAPMIIQSPLRGDRWIAMNGPSNASPHRRAILPVDGKAMIGQRYAIDWVQVGDDGHTYTGDKSDNRSYRCYNQPIHAAADGKIMEVKDGVAENIPNSGKIAVEMRWDTIAGNHIIEDFGNGRYAAYAHLRPGSITVKVGDSVHAGDVIAHLGNTGNSSEPHLHFQICTLPSFIKSEGLPFAIDRFTRVDYKTERLGGGKEKLVIGTTHEVTKEEPLENELDNFAAP